VGREGSCFVLNIERLIAQGKSFPPEKRVELVGTFLENNNGTSTELELLADLLIHDSTNDPHKVSKTEYPILSNDQWKTRWNREVSFCPHFLDSVELDNGYIPQTPTERKNRKTAQHTIPLGLSFEKILGDILTELEVPFKKGYSRTIKPDFNLGNKWIDAKLSKTTYLSPTCKTIEKYEPLCEELELVYLIGDSSTQVLTEKTKLVHVSEYTKELPKDKQIFYQKLLDELVEQYF
jgi:hypothetical protein